jgi:hypothetical protein
MRPETSFDTQGLLIRSIISLLSVCSPFVACIGGVGREGCGRGYTGERCAECVAFDGNLDDSLCDDTNPNGYYRLDERCEPCPCNRASMEVIIGTACVLLTVVMVLLDHVLRDVDHLSSIFAPVMIVIQFFQTLALLLDLDVAWPPELRALLSKLNALNINVEFARPECTRVFGAREKLEFTLAIPCFVLFCLGVYCLVKLALSRRVQLEEFKLDHRGKSISEVLISTSITVTASSFVFGSIFFLRRVLLTWVCTDEAGDDEPGFLIVEPDIVCSLDNDEYSALHYLSLLGLVIYLGCFATFAIALYFKRDLFEFLGDKFEDEYYFWELVLVVRKVLIMACLVVFSDMAEKAWFMASTVMVASLVLHSGTKPYEDRLIDVCEFLSLASTLFIFQTGVVFKVVNDPADPLTGEKARSLSNGLETAAISLVNVLLGAYIQARVSRLATEGDEDYRVRLIIVQHAQLERALEKTKEGLARAKAFAAANEERRSVRSKSIEPEENVDSFLDDLQLKNREGEFDNPVASERDDDGDSVGDDRSSESAA